MNQNLQNIVEIIQQSEKLDAEQKKNLIKAVKDADKELEIIAFKLERTEKVKKTTAILLEETIAELEQKRKDVEKHNRELEIEASLEKVRSRTMAMQKSEDMNHAASDMFKQIQSLGMHPWACGFNIFDKDEKAVTQYMSLADGGISPPFRTPLTEDPFFINIYNARQRRDELLVWESKGESLAETYRYMFGLPGSREIFGDLEYSGFEMPKFQITHCAYFSQGYLVFITYEHVPEAHDIFKRFAKVFEQTYIRFLDLQKAEAQAREAEIELALERVRARTMAMQKSEELAEVASIVFDQLNKLGVQHLASGVSIIDKDKPTGQMWISYRGDMHPKPFIIDFNSNPVLSRVYKSWKEGDPFFINQTSGQEFTQHIQFLKKIFGERVEQYMEATKKQFKDAGKEMPGQMVMHHTFFSNGSLILNNTEPIKEQEILNRFAKVFDQTYTRFLDLQKAEAQARESEIQLALERVRARTMAMHQSTELNEVVALMYEQVKKLGVSDYGCSIIICDEKSKVMHYWYAEVNQSQSHRVYNVPVTNQPVVQKQWNSWRKGISHFRIELTGKEKEEYDDFLITETDHKYLPSKVKIGWQALPKVYFTYSNMKYGLLEFVDVKPINEDNFPIYQRFAKVFEQTYTRFLDLKKSEAQAREAQIEAALERVRARSIGMHKSNELKDVVRLLYKEFRILVTNIDSVNIQLNLDSSKDIHFWASVEEDIYPELYHLPYSDLPIFEKFYNAFNSPGGEFFDYLLNKKEKDAFFSEVFKIQPVPPQRKKMIKNAEGMVMMGWFHKHSGIDILRYNLNHFSEEEKQIVKRFAAAFEQTYIRFLDLQKAEAQAREANIVAALERVRSLALGMRKSEEVGQVTDSFFAEFIKLTVKIVGCSIVVVDEKNDSMEIWRARSHVAVRPFSKTSLTLALKKMKEETPEWYEGFHKTLGSKSGYLKEELSGEKRLRFLRSIAEQSSFTPEEKARFIKMIPSQVVLSFLFFKLGYLALISEKELPQENLSIARRFADVFDFAYTRFIDLQKAEVQAKEAVKQASLDRVRGEIASMRTTEDLNRITPVIWRELKTLEVPFIRCGVFIVNEANKSVGVFLTTPDGKALGVLHLAFDSNELTSNTVKSWQKNQVYKEHWNKEDFINWTKSMMKLGQVQNPETYQGSSQPPESLHLHFVPFTQGMLYVGNTSPLNEDKLELAKTLAEAFSIAYARYEDFKNLEEAKAAVENTLKELKSAQAQLVHSEKMASLGELTAGIAHEIKNPLNFVNNFSEVSGELLDEMKEELKNKNEEEVASLIEDLKQNLEKINQHGKRADSIVKGMLLHSRGTAGEKAPTDINDLLEQYVNLAYHGMRAQNKDFNIKIERDYDKTLEKVNVVPQDISRVFLNIINNGCYAANDKKKTAGDGFSPAIKVSTKSLNGKAEIRIKDNGNGVPDKIKDKLFQPFFTTKPTGEGTGLGLSLSYDIIVKQHGGEIKIDSKEGEGAEFIIQLPYN